MSDTYYAWDYIYELEERRLLSISEKESLCEKISHTVKKPSTALTIMVKVIPVPALILTYVGMILANATVLGWVILMAAVFCLVAALFLYIVKEVWVYDRWKRTRKNVMKEDVYAVPVEIGHIWEAEDKFGGYLITLRYTADKEFSDTYRISEETYKKNGELICYYYKGAREKYKGPYKIFYIE